MALGPGQSLDGLFHWKCCPWIGRVWYDLLLVVCSKFISVSYDIRALLKSEACQKFMVVDYSIVSNHHRIVQAFYLTVKVSLSGCLAIVFTDCTGSGWLKGWIMLSAVSCPTLFVIQLIIEIDNVHFTNMGVSLPPPLPYVPLPNTCFLGTMWVCPLQMASRLVYSCTRFIFNR